MSEAVFDTTILLDALGDVKAAQAELSRYTRRYVSRVTWIELMVMAQPDEAATAEGFMSHFTVLEVNEQVGRRAAMLRSQRKGLSLASAIILATAQDAGRILITRNVKDFPATMPGIRVPYTL